MADCPSSMRVLSHWATCLSCAWVSECASVCVIKLYKCTNFMHISMHKKEYPDTVEQLRNYSLSQIMMSWQCIACPFLYYIIINTELVITHPVQHAPINEAMSLVHQTWLGGHQVAPQALRHVSTNLPQYTTIRHVMMRVGHLRVQIYESVYGFSKFSVLSYNNSYSYTTSYLPSSTSYLFSYSHSEQVSVFNCTVCMVNVGGGRWERERERLKHDIVMKSIVFLW